MIPLLQRSEAGHAEIALGVGVLLLWAPAAAGASRAAGPERSFTAARPVRPRGRRRSADQPGRALDRLCPPLRRHHDRPLPPLDLADRHRAPARQTPLARGASQPRWSPDGDRLAYIAAADGGRRAALRALDGRPARRCAITGLPDAPIERRLVARRPPDRLCDVRARRGRAARPAAAAAGGRAMGASRCR